MKFHPKSINQKLWNQKDFWSWKQLGLFFGCERKMIRVFLRCSVCTAVKWCLWSRRFGGRDRTYFTYILFRYSLSSPFSSLSLSYFRSGEMGIRIPIFSSFALMTCPTVEWVSNVQRALWHCSSAKMHFRLNQERENERKRMCECARVFAAISMKMKCHNLFTVFPFLVCMDIYHYFTNAPPNQYAHNNTRVFAL